MTRQEIYKRLNKKAKDELLVEIMTLYDKFGAVQEYYGFSQSKRKKDHDKIIEDYKRKIINALWPDGDFQGGLDLDEVDRLLSKFSKITDNIEYHIEFELYIIEQANKCAIDFGGDFGEEYYEYLEEQFERTLSKMIKNELFEHKKEKLKALIDNSFEGYGHRDILEELIKKYESTTNVIGTGY